MSSGTFGLAGPVETPPKFEEVNRLYIASGRMMLRRRVITDCSIGTILEVVLAGRDRLLKMRCVHVGDEWLTFEEEKKMPKSGKSYPDDKKSDKKKGGKKKGGKK